jgi:hypothetical protein
MGQWALFHDGWFLSTKVNRAPWEAFGPANPDPLNNQVLELFNLNKDFSQTENLAAKNPQKVKELKQMFIAEAKKYQVFPMDASVAARVIAPRPNITAGRSEFVYTRPMVGLPQGDSPLLLNTSYTITADIEVPQGGAEGMILTSGGRFAGGGRDQRTQLIQSESSDEIQNPAPSGVFVAASSERAIQVEWTFRNAIIDDYESPQRVTTDKTQS